MKRYCKNINILDRNLIIESIKSCLKGKLTRRDSVELISRITNTSCRITRLKLKIKDERFLSRAIERIADEITEELTNEKLNLIPIWYSEKYDTSSLKTRRIGIQDIKQQIYDYIAVNALSPFFVRIGEYQCAALPNRGQSYGAKAIRKWLKKEKNNPIFYLKVDIEKCYENISQKNMMKFLRKYIKNDKLLWLIETLILTFEKGLSIGSYLSQYLSNLYLSQLYHFISEQIENNYVSHVLFYMDDIVVFGKNREELKYCQLKIEEFAAQLGLTIKPHWFIQKIDNTYFLDVMGFKFYKNKTTIRKRVFAKIRRLFLRLRRRKFISLSLARRAVSYFGFIKHTNSFILYQKYKISTLIKSCKGAISYASRISIHSTPT